MNTQAHAQTLRKLALQIVTLAKFNPGQYSQLGLDTMSICAYHPGAGYKLEVDVSPRRLATETNLDAHYLLNVAVRESCNHYQKDMRAGLIQPVFPISTGGLCRLLIVAIKRDIPATKTKTKPQSFQPKSESESPPMSMAQTALHLITQINCTPAQYSNVMLESNAMIIYHPGAQYKLDREAILKHDLADRPEITNAALRASCAHYEADVFAGRIHPHIPISKLGILRLLATSIKRDILALFTPKVTR